MAQEISMTTWGPHAHGCPHLYVFGCTTGDVKIGRTGDVQKRLAKFKIMCPASIKLHALHVGYGLGAYELTLHRRFREYRTHGEWFGPEVGAALQAIPQDAFSMWVRSLGLPVHSYGAAGYDCGR